MTTAATKQIKTNIHLQQQKPERVTFTTRKNGRHFSVYVPLSVVCTSTGCYSMHTKISEDGENNSFHCWFKWHRLQVLIGNLLLRHFNTNTAFLFCIAILHSICTKFVVQSGY